MSYARGYTGVKCKAYNSWVAMRQRCNNPRNQDYHNYGGRGITICAEWDTFEGFLTDMGLPTNQQSLDRIDSNLGYYKANCRWADKFTQGRNKRTTRLTMDDAKEIRRQVANGASYKTVAARFKINHGGVSLIVNGINWRESGVKS